MTTSPSSPASPASSPLPIILQTPRLSLRPFHPSQIPAIVTQANNPIVARYLSHSFPSPYTIADAQAWLNTVTTTTTNDPRVLILAIYNHGHNPNNNKDPPQFIGTIGLTRPYPDDSNGELGYWLGQAFWGSGLATELVRHFIPYCFDRDPTLRCIRAEIEVDNVGSCKVLERNGFVGDPTVKRRTQVCQRGEITEVDNRNGDADGSEEEDGDKVVELVMYTLSREQVPVLRGHKKDDDE